MQAVLLLHKCSLRQLEMSRYSPKIFHESSLLLADEKSANS